MLLNPSTGVYEGHSKLHSHSTWDNHTRDDKRLLARERMSATNQSSHIISHIPPALEPQANLIRLVEQEVLWYNDLPVTTPTVPLLFINNPMLYGEYQWGESLIPNSSLHALCMSCYANLALLMTEHQLCELVMVLQSSKMMKPLLSVCGSTMGWPVWTMKRSSNGFNSEDVMTLGKYLWIPVHDKITNCWYPSLTSLFVA
jgi:hypothetical protein